VNAEEKHRESGPGGGASPAGFTPLDQAFDAGSLYALRAAVGAHAAAALGRHQVYDVTAVAHELAANAVVHGAGHGRLRLWAAGRFLYCQVSDDGRAGSADAAGQAADGAAPWPAEHGHGLWMAGQVADDLGIVHGPDGTTATARFRLRPG
jgi:anti-sigma regulatory factor (Ser/Thr protein kinase)